MHRRAGPGRQARGPVQGRRQFVFGRGFEEVAGLRRGRRPVHRRPRAHQPDRGTRRSPASRSPTAASPTSSPSSPATCRPDHPELAGRLGRRGRLRGTLRAADGRRERARDRRAPCSPAAAAAATPVAVVVRRQHAARADACSRRSAALAGRPRPRQAVRPPAIIVIGEVVAVATPTPARRTARWLSVDRARAPRRRRRPRRPAAGRLPRPARRRAAQAPRGRARAVPRRGREGGPPRGRGRLRAAVVPDGAALARRARRRARPAPTRPATSSSEALAEQVTGFHVHRGALASLQRPPLPHRRRGARRRPLGRWCSRTSSTTPTSARSSAPARRSASTPCCSSPRCADPLYRRSVKVAMGAVFSVPWTRLADWYDALPDAVRRRASPPSRSRSADDAVDPSRRRWPASTAGARARVGGARAVAALADVGRRAARSSRWRPASTRSTSPRPPRSPATSPPAADRRRLAVTLGVAGQLGRVLLGRVVCWLRSFL